jgi:hypothetical protein
VRLFRAQIRQRTVKTASSPRGFTTRLAEPNKFPKPLRVSDRLNELRRQRALVEQQLAWLDAEIAAASAKTRPLVPTAQPSTSELASPIESISLHDEPGSAELAELISEQKAAPAQSAAEVRRGCFVAFGVLLLLLAAAVFALYLYTKSRH